MSKPANLRRQRNKASVTFALVLREQVVEAVERDSLSCNQATARFEVAVSRAIDWVNRYRDRQRDTWPAPPAEEELSASIENGSCSAAGSVTSPCAGWSASWPERGLPRDLGLFLHEQKLSHKKITLITSERDRPCGASRILFFFGPHSLSRPARFRSSMFSCCVPMRR